MEFSYNFHGEKEEIICRTKAKKTDRMSREIMQAYAEERTEAFFLPVSITEGSEGYIFAYDISGMVNLRAWMYETTENERKRMRREISEKQRKIFEMGVSQDQLVTEDRYMYVDEKTQHIKFICIPVTSEINIRHETEPSLPLIPPTPSETFLDMEKKAAAPIVPNCPEIWSDMKEYGGFEVAEENAAEDFYGTSDRLFQKKKINLEKEEMDGAETVLGIMQPTGQTFRKEEKLTGYSDREVEKINPDDFEEENIHIEEMEQKDVSIDSDEDGTVLLKSQSDEDGEDRTVLLKPSFQIRAALYRVRTGETVKLNKNITVIGKSNKRVDMVIEENPTISRKHCTIYFDNGIYYLEDNGSSNGSWLDNKKLQPQEKVVLANESKIHLSNEDFIFYIE